MNLNLVKFILSFVLMLNILPACAGINGSISKSSFYDTEKTIMTDLSNDKTIITGKYWGKNLLYPYKYKPLFMLSNKDLVDLNPVKQTRVVKRVRIPAVYNISLTSASITPVSLKQEIKSIPQDDDLINANPETDWISLYEQSKSSDVEVKTKIESAVLLRNSNKQSNYNLAIDLLDDVLQMEPYNAYAYYLKGELYSIQNSPELAMKNYIKALKINPASKECFIGIAKILEPKNKQLAQKYYNMAEN